MAQEKQNIARASYTTTQILITVVREAISKNSVLKDIMPWESNGGNAFRISVRFLFVMGTIVSADYATKRYSRKWVA